MGGRHPDELLFRLRLGRFCNDGLRRNLSPARLWLKADSFWRSHAWQRFAKIVINDFVFLRPNQIVIDWRFRSTTRQQPKHSDQGSVDTQGGKQRSWPKWIAGGLTLDLVNGTRSDPNLDGHWRQSPCWNRARQFREYRLQSSENWECSLN